MKSVDRHKINECPVCKRTMRSDSLKRHKLTKHKNFNFQVTTIIKDHVKDGGILSDRGLESEIVAN